MGAEMTETSALRERIADDLKTAMRAREALAVSTLRLIVARFKEADIAARPQGIERVPDDALVPVLRSMVKQRADSVALYRQGGREELARKELDETAIIERYLPAGLDDAALARAVEAAIASTGAETGKDMGRVMAALKQAHGASLDMARAGQAVRARLG